MIHSNIRESKIKFRNRIETEQIISEFALPTCTPNLTNTGMLETVRLGGTLQSRKDAAKDASKPKPKEVKEPKETKVTEQRGAAKLKTRFQPLTL